MLFLVSSLFMAYRIDIDALLLDKVKIVVSDKINTKLIKK